MSKARRLVCVLLSSVVMLATIPTCQGWQMKQGPLMTQWDPLIDTNAPLPEYPRPQLVRSNWLNLNGIWQFQPGATNDPVPVGVTLSNQILVPYPMESAISGVMQYSEFSWYRRTFTVPAGWAGQRIILHLDAVTWQATVYVNGQQVGVHQGGYDPFSYNITPYLNGGTNELIIGVYSPEDNGGQPRGKQTLYPGGIMYTSSSGIWQPVWLEPVDADGIANLQIIPDVDHSQLRLTVNCYNPSGVSVIASVLSNGVPVNAMTGSPQTELDIPVPTPNLWSPDNPFLYGLQIWTIHNGITNDFVTSYFGMRKISIATVNGVPQMFLNNQPYFETGTLDQGFWPDGIYTAPTDAALAYDLQMEKAMGFNMVRKHIKVERQRWYYWADTLGLLVWQDMPSCNSYTGNQNPPPVNALDFIAELTAMVTNHWNSPSIIMWDTFNEAQGQQNTYNGVGQTNTAYLVQLVQTLDPSRLVDQASGGNYYGVGNVYDNHSYPAPGDPVVTTQAPVDGEYGGIGYLIAGHLWNPSQASTAYISAATTNDIATGFDGFANDLVQYKTANGLNAAVYTQITDVENECDGLMTYDRLMKPSAAMIYNSNQKSINGLLYLTSVLPTSQYTGRTWSYTTRTPPTNWYAANFDASSWSTGQAGFGTAGTPGAVVRTTWNTSDIWIRQTFTLGSLTPQDIANLVFYLYHDEGCQIYLNGVFAGSTTGYATSYITLPMNAAGQSALIPNGTNTIAVHCINTAGGQDIDVGISEQDLVMNSLVVPTDY
ncbi:MAG TPA: glycoside hydrolase family 2 TIM barrel-domain containing protein, partial [Verrucomicrobiae bacterium]|nr:glycoside hydrolase family 2 TIM barrel-domain containing protein [Verrucomicrobiae bacterium]